MTLSYLSLLLVVFYSIFSITNVCFILLIITFCVIICLSASVELHLDKFLCIFLRFLATRKLLYFILRVFYLNLVIISLNIQKSIFVFNSTVNTWHLLTFFKIKTKIYILDCFNIHLQWEIIVYFESYWEIYRVLLLLLKSKSCILVLGRSWKSVLLLLCNIPWLTGLWFEDFVIIQGNQRFFCFDVWNNSTLIPLF